MKRFTVIIITLVFVLGISFLSIEEGKYVYASQDQITWKISSAFSPGSLLYKGMLTKFAEEVAKRSNNQLQIKKYPPGALVKVRELFNVVQKGIVQGGISAGLYHARVIPEGIIETGLPQSFLNYNEAVEFYYRYKNGRVISLIREAYAEKGIYYLAIYPLASYVLMTKFPVKNLSDLKGKKIRTFGPYSLLAKKLGWATVSIPGAEQYIALQRGTVEGTIYPFYALEMYKLKEVINYVILPPITGSIMTDFYINKKAWDRLPENLKKICNDVAMELVPWVCSETERLDKKFLNEAIKKGVKVVSLPEKDVQQLRSVSISIWDVFAKKGPRCKELIDLLKEYLKEKGRL